MVYGKGVLVFEESVVFKSILVWFIGDDFKFFIVLFKVVVFYYCIGVW